MAGKKADEIILTGQDCDYEPPCVREAKEIGTFNNGDSGKHKFEIRYTVSTSKGIYPVIHSCLAFRLKEHTIT